ncbi:f-box only protein [Anaeramoeba ignava]|uniref:F-box only protein n=1 Tax=Anaeramoeba ignava TaxID=1746090 RepID=A0A9Q0LK29_ANAIG|nr:f-box only protein [Anaeramoeba ignava]
MNINLNEIIVNQQPNQNISTRTFRTITEALKEAKAGEIIKIMAGNYKESIVITQPGIMLTGPDDPNEEVIVENNNEKSTIIFNSVSARISKITIKFSNENENSDQISDFSLRTQEFSTFMSKQSTRSKGVDDENTSNKPSVYSQFPSRANDSDFEKGFGRQGTNSKFSTSIAAEKLSNINTGGNANGGIILDDSESEQDDENNLDQKSVIQMNIQEQHKGFLNIQRESDSEDSDDNISVVLNIKRDYPKRYEKPKLFRRVRFHKSAILARSGKLQIDSCKIYSSTYGIVVERNSSVVLRSNKFLGCKKTAVLFNNSKNSTIQNNFISKCFHGIDLFDCENIKISSNKIGNCENGIFSTGGGMFKIEQNDIFQNNTNGIEIQNQSNPSIISNTIFKNGLGISISKNGLSVISRNEIESNKTGIKIADESSQGTVKKNTIFSNNSNGIEIVNYSQPLVSNNEIYKNKKNGCAILNNGNGSFDKNDIYENNFSGIAIQDSSNPTITNCTVRNNQESGIVIFANSSGIIQKCAIFENHLYGIMIDHECTPNIQQNIISANKKGAIQALSGSKAKLSDNEMKKDANCNLM